jgi:hypothetical protein
VKILRTFLGSLPLGYDQAGGGGRSRFERQDDSNKALLFSVLLELGHQTLVNYVADFMSSHKPEYAMN